MCVCAHSSHDVLDWAENASHQRYVLLNENHNITHGILSYKLLWIPQRSPKTTNAILVIHQNHMIETLLAKDTTHFAYKTKRNPSQTNWENAHMLVSFYSARKSYVVC